VHQVSNRNYPKLIDILYEFHAKQHTKLAQAVCVFVCATLLQVSKGTAVIISCFVGAYEIWAI
jgi:hypothetical protein